MQSETILERTSKLLDTFNQHKKVFEDLCSVNIPKIHSLQHYKKSIQDFGTPDNYDTEYTEHQHIIDVKQPYLHTNRRHHIPQMIQYVQRRMVFENKMQYLEYLKNSKTQKSSSIHHQYSLGSPSPNNPILISSASIQYKVKNLELLLRTFLHNRLYPDGEGKRHRVKRRKLPGLHNPEVSDFPSYHQCHLCCC